MLYNAMNKSSQRQVKSQNTLASVNQRPQHHSATILSTLAWLVASVMSSGLR